ncbi:MAG: DUF1206 domain-containing protein [Geminicoccaceae bacterium]|nr:DUF1206 domain-containing protein [Geminicoccaceae bacterium]
MNEAERMTRQAAEKAQPSAAVVGLARFGYAARGVVYVIVGGLATLAAFGSGGSTTDSRGALRTLLGQPFGEVLLGIVAAGLLAYALWRAIQATLDVDDHGTDAKGLAVRAGLAVSAVTHVALAVFAASLIFTLAHSGGGAQSGGGGGGGDWTATVMRQPFGRWAVGFAGLCVIGAGIAMIVKGIRKGYEKRFAVDWGHAPVLGPVCRFGLIARGGVFLITGSFFITAAWQADPDEAQGLAGAMRVVQDQPFGWALFSLLALGLLAFGLYSMIEAYYRTFDIGDRAGEGD